ncbi:MAG: hypothetical protein WCL05_06305 [Verrucomicrobiota bacterium]
MSQDLTVNVKTTSDVPQAMDKAKSATVSFAKQVDDVSKKFSTAFKDIALSFLAPLVILNSAISAISSAIAENKQKIKDAMDFVVKGESKYLRPGTVSSGREIERKRQDALDRKNAKLGAEAYAQDQMDADKGFLGFGGEADKAVSQYISGGNGFMDTLGRTIKGTGMLLGINNAAGDEDIQKVLESRSQARDVNDPQVQAQAKATGDAIAQKTNDDADKAKGTSFKGPEGFSNVIGVGANPVMEAMTMQLEEARKQTALLEILARPAGGGVPVDYTKSTSSSPSRAAMLSGK